MRTLAKAGAAATIAAALFLVGASGAFRSLPARPASAPAAQDPAALLVRPATGSLDPTIASLQQRLRRSPDDWQGLAALGLAYVQQARVTADPSYYPRAEGVLERSLAIRGENEVALLGLAALAAARHDFAASLRYGEMARELNPYDASAFGVIGDALLELGRYDAAFDAYQAMIDRRPDLASYARASYARELQGDVPGAIEAMERARSFAASRADAAWASYQLGELRFGTGDLAGAAAEYRRGIGEAPGFVPNLAGLAKVAWARGDLDRAIRGYEEVVERYPTAEHAIALGELYRAAGRGEDAARTFALVDAIGRLSSANGVNVDLELALYEADHGDPLEALAAARAEWERRRSVHVADALAWALHANGRDAEALRYARRALSLGTRNALFLFHAGMIARALGQDALAVRYLGAALETNPRFSIRWSTVAERALARLVAGR